MTTRQRACTLPEGGGSVGATLAIAALLAVSLRGTAWADPATISESAASAEESIAALDLDEARAALAHGDPDDPAIAVQEALLSTYEDRCDDALVALGRPDILKTESGSTLYDVARGCARVTAATVVDTDDARGVVVRYQDEGDRPLTPLIVETVVRARETLTRDLGVSWAKPTRVTVVRDLMSLAAMTGLPLQAAQTTGTVAVAKWGRVTLLSPRASEHGFPWRDTLAHELTHLAVTHASGDRAPLWLQEGIAKREESRWRSPGPFDDRPSPDAVTIRGFELGLALPLDQLGPSIAMLPSPDAAMVAFAEVTSFVRYLAANAGPEALPRLLDAIRHAPDPDTALRDSSGADLHAWDARWRADLTGRPHEPLPAIYGLGAVTPDLRELRQRVRLAELLYGRSHPAAALAELDHVSGEAASRDPSLRTLRASVLGALGRKSDGEREVRDPWEVASSFAPWWAIRGRWEREDGDGAHADESFVEAVGISPFDVQAACEVDDSEAGPTENFALGAVGATLCDAARARNEPPLGRD
jgi:hypothetical protein